jgi:lipid-A-disaccharide synthase
VEIHVGRTPEILAVADAAVAVSGSVSLELMYYRVPSAIVYRISPFLQHVLRPMLLKSKYVTLVNLMADRMIYPEFVGSRDESAQIAQTVGDWLASPAKLAAMRVELGELVARFGKPGATDAAAAAIVRLAERNAAAQRKAA